MANVQMDREQLSGEKRLSSEEMDLRRYEARIGLWKVIWGTFIVGLAGVLVPGAINFFNIFFDNWRKQAELKFAVQTAHQQYIADFFHTAVQQNIELRIRFANYFAHLSGIEQKYLWTDYLTDLKGQRDEARTRINTLAAQLVELKGDPPKYDKASRELGWAIDEVGYAPLTYSVVVESSTGKKERLYKETTDIVERLATFVPVSEQSPDFIRFWELYRRDLIGTESSEVASKMRSIGNELNMLAKDGTLTKEQLKQLSDELLVLTTRELRNVPRKE